jgi:tRNA(Ile2) C34 agmatinyltransferase TiaS
MIIKINESQYKRILEVVTKKEVICDNCGWSWKLSDGGDDPYTCHKCGHINSKENAVT